MSARSALVCLALIAIAPWREGVAAPPWAFDAAGRAARADRSWVLGRADGRPLDIITALAACGTRLFVADTQGGLFEMDAEQAGAGLRAIAADRLAVLETGRRAVITRDLRSGAVLATQPFQRELSEARSLIVSEAGVAYTGGLWNADVARGLPARAAGDFFEKTWIGERVAAGREPVTGALARYEGRCAAAGACTFADLDRIAGPGPPAWAAAHGISRRLATYDAAGRRLAELDVTSPRFVRDGSELSVAAPPEVSERWKSRNSLIRRVFAASPYLVAVHALTVIGPGWRSGEQSQFTVYANVFDLDGAALISDLRLADLPVGRDASHLYVVDYGAGGRRNGADRLTLERIPIVPGAAAVR